MASVNAFAMLEEVLTVDEAQNLPDSIRKKLEDHLQLHARITDALRDENASLAARYNRISFELETSGTESREKLIASEQACERLQAQLAELNEKLRVSQDELQQARSDLSSTSCSLDVARKNLEQLAAEKAELLDTLEKRQKKIDKLNEDAKRLSDELTASKQLHQDVLVTLEELKIREVTLQHNESRLSQEKELLQKQVADLTEDLHGRLQEVASLRREKTMVACDLRAELDNHKEMVRVLESQLESWKATAQEKEQRAEGLARRLKEAQESHASLEEHFQKELRAQTKLTELYKQSDEGSKARVQELLDAVAEMQGLLQEAQASSKELETTLNDSQIQAQQVINEKEEIIAKLKEDVDAANRLIQARAFTTQELERLFPAAAATSRVLQSGPTLTELVHEHYKQQEELVKLKHERDSLRQHIDEIDQEVSSKMPIYHRIKEEYDKALESIHCMREQQTSILVEKEALARERDDARRLLSHTERELARWKQQCEDLAVQVRHLLREVEDARQGYAPHARPDEEQHISSSDDTPSVAGEVITQRLVAFKDIEELQKKNMELLAVVRELSGKQEEEEKKAAQERSEQVHAKLEAAMSRLEALEEERKHQAVLTAALAKQRDTYKALLAHKNIDLPSEASQTAAAAFEPSSTSTPAVRRTSPAEKSVLEQSAAEARAALQELQQEYNTYRAEMVQNNKLLSDQLENQREEASKLRVQAARVQAELEFTQERLALAQTNMDSFRKEASTLHDRNIKLSNTIAQLEQAMVTMRQELQAAQERASQAEVSLEGIRAERDLLRAREDRLLQEHEAMRRDKASSERIVANLQMVQANLERLDAETRSNMQTKVNKLELQCESLNAQLHSQDEQHKAFVAKLEKQLEEAKARADQGARQAHKAQDELVEAYAQLHEARQQLSALQSKSSAVTEGQEPASSEGVSALKSLLKKTQDRLKESEERLVLLQNSADSFKSMLLEAEGRLSEQGAVNEDYKQAMERSLQEAAQTATYLEERVKALESEKEDIINASREEAAQQQQKVESLQQDLQRALQELEALRQQTEAENRRDDTLLDDHSFQAALAKEAQEKYERELMLHAADVEALSATKAQLLEVQMKVASLEQAASNAHAKLEKSYSSWKEEEQLLLSEKEQLVATVKDLRDQNTALHEQLETLSGQLSAVESRDWKGITPEEQNKSTAQLMDVIRYLRREKEVSLKQAEASAAEAMRLKVQVDHQAARLQELENELKEEREKVLAKATNDDQYAELLRKVEMVNILSESNSVLREEKEAVSERNKELVTKVSELEGAMIPLREELRTLTNQLEAARSENTVLKSELQRWQARTSQLMEQTSRTDPEDFKRMAEENTNLRQQLQAQKDELQSVKTQLQQSIEENVDLKARLASVTEDTKKLRGESAALPQLRRELLSARSEAERQRAEATRLAAEAEKFKEDKEEKLKTIIQVKKIARKYRSQYEEIKAEKDAIDARLADVVSKQQESSDQATSETESKLLELEQKSAELTESLEKAKAEIARVTEEKEQVNTAAAENQEKARKLMLQARKRISDLNAKSEGLTKTNEDLKAELQRVQSQVLAMEQAKDEVALRESTLKSQYEGRLQRQERDLRDKNEALEKALQQLEELTQKLAQQKQAKPTMAAAPVERSSCSGAVEPVTANVRPLTPPSVPAVSGSGGGLRQGPGSVAARLTPTASIRPMAQTRLATVVPTTATVPSPSSSGESHPSPVPVASVQPDVLSTPTAAAVPPSQVQEAANTSEVPALPGAQVDASEPSVVSAVATASAEAAAATGLLTVAVGSDDATDSRTSQLPQSSAGQHKRLWEEAAEEASTRDAIRETPEEERLNKRMKTEEAELDAVEEQKAVAEEEDYKDEDGHSGASETAGQPTVQEAEGGSPKGLASEAPVKDLEDPSHVIVVESDDQGIEEEDDEVQQQKGIEEPVEGDLEKEESGMEDEGSASEDEDMNRGYAGQQEMVEGEEESMPIEDITEQDIAEEEGIDEECAIIEAGMEDTGDNDVEIIDVVEETDEGEMEEPVDTVTVQDEDETAVAPPGPQACPQISVQRASPTSSPSLAPSAPIPGSPLQRPSLLTRSRSERLPSSQSAAGFEEGDDSIVPSTPTLFVPRRADGFAEAVSSPHVPHGGFVFGSGPDTSTSQETSGISQLASQGAVGVDDTRMDLSHFEEGGGQSVPSTPLQVSPPESRDASLFQAEATLADGDSSRMPADAGRPMPMSERSVPGPVITETADEVDDGLATVVPVIEGSLEDAEEGPREKESGPSTSPSVTVSAVSSSEVTGRHRATGTDDEKAEEEEEGDDVQAAVARESEPASSVSSEQQAAGGASQAADTQQQQQSQRRRIVWDAPAEPPSAAAVAPVPSTPTLPPAANATVIPTRASHYSPTRGGAAAPTTAAAPRPSTTRGVRGRRVRLRGIGPSGRNNPPSGPAWGTPGWRGSRGGQGSRPSRGGHHF